MSWGRHWLGTRYPSVDFCKLCCSFCLQLIRQEVIYSWFFFRSRWKAPAVIRRGRTKNIYVLIAPCIAFLCGCRGGHKTWRLRQLIPSHMFTVKKPQEAAKICCSSVESGRQLRRLQAHLFIIRLYWPPSLDATFGLPSCIEWLQSPMLLIGCSPLLVNCNNLKELAPRGAQSTSYFGVVNLSFVSVSRCPPLSYIPAFSLKHDVSALWSRNKRSRQKGDQKYINPMQKYLRGFKK